MGRRFRVRRLELSQDLYTSDGSNGPSFLRKVTLQHGERMVAAGRAIQHRDPDTNESLGFQLVPQNGTPGLRKSCSGAAPESKPSSAMLTIGEAEAAIGFDGVSRTENLPEWARMQRLVRGLKDVDHIELAKVKLAAMAPVYSA
jgi:hypothetical protein